MKNKTRTSIICFLSDIIISIYSYYAVKDYDQFQKMIRPMVNSPELEAQIYDLLIQGLIATLLIFLLLHFIIFLYYVKGASFATKYFRFYSGLAALSSLIMLLTGTSFATIPLALYIYCFVSSRRT